MKLEKLLELLADNSKTKIQAYGISLEDKDIAKIVKVINLRTTPIQVLDLSENELSDNCVKSLLKIQPGFVNDLNLHNNNLTVTGACLLSESELFPRLALTRNNLKLDTDIVRTIAQHFRPGSIKCLDGNRILPGNDRTVLYEILAHRA